MNLPHKRLYEHEITEQLGINAYQLDDYILKYNIKWLKCGNKQCLGLKQFNWLKKQIKNSPD
jgi:hypothetical protein